MMRRGEAKSGLQLDETALDELDRIEAEAEAMEAEADEDILSNEKPLSNGATRKGEPLIFQPVPTVPVSPSPQVPNQVTT